MNTWLIVLIIISILFFLIGGGVGLYFILKKHGDKSGDKSLSKTPIKIPLDSPYTISPPSAKGFGNTTFAVSSLAGLGFWDGANAKGPMLKNPIKNVDSCENWLFTYANISGESGNILENVLLWNGDGKSILTIGSAFYDYNIYFEEPNFNADPKAYSWFYSPTQKIWTSATTSGVLGSVNKIDYGDNWLRMLDFPANIDSYVQWDIVDESKIKQCSG